MCLQLLWASILIVKRVDVECSFTMYLRSYLPSVQFATQMSTSQQPIPFPTQRQTATTGYAHAP